MRLPHQVWEQLRNKTADELVTAIERDGFVQDARKGSERIYRHPDGRRVSIHYHPRKTYGPGLLRALLDNVGWDASDLKRLKLVK